MFERRPQKSGGESRNAEQKPPLKILEAVLEGLRLKRDLGIQRKRALDTFLPEKQQPDADASGGEEKVRAKDDERREE